MKVTPSIYSEIKFTTEDLGILRGSFENIWRSKNDEPKETGIYTGVTGSWFLL